MSTAVAPVRPAGAGSLERELKYVLPAGRAFLARKIVSALCQPDPVYPAATVFTIYYDTPDLALLSEKLNSDYLKTKVRLRWYSTPAAPGATGTFLEIKSRVGVLRQKVRVETPLSAKRLQSLTVDHPDLVAVLELARPLGVALPSRLMPALLLRYERHRYVDAFSGSRISVDSDVEASSGNPRIVGHAFPVRLRHAVVEAKGAEDDLPRILHPLIRIGARKDSFSKYATAAFAMLRYVP
jgi:hypothetical protein